MKHQSQGARCQEEGLDARQFSGKTKWPRSGILYVVQPLQLEAAVIKALKKRGKKGDTILIFYICLIQNKDLSVKKWQIRMEPQVWSHLLHISHVRGPMQGMNRVGISPSQNTPD